MPTLPHWLPWNSYQVASSYGTVMKSSSRKPKCRISFMKVSSKAGSKVSVTGDPRCAVLRFSQESTVADGVLFCAQSLSGQGLLRNNSLADDYCTKNVRAILLLEEYQKDWKDEALVAEHRIVLTMPITMKEVRGALHELIHTPLHGEISVIGASVGKELDPLSSHVSWRVEELERNGLICILVPAFLSAAR